MAPLKQEAQTVTGYLSNKTTSAAQGCGCTGCNDATTNAAANYPDPFGCCGVTEPIANSGSCTRTTKTRTIVVPAGCTVNGTVAFGDRTGCSGSTQGPGMDASDAYSAIGSGGTTNANVSVSGMSSNFQSSNTFTQVGGQIVFSLTADRVAELLTYTLTFSGPGCTPSPLPITLIHFSVEELEEGFHLFWATASEQNSHYFEVEYSADGSSFYSLAHEPAAGNSQSQKEYSIQVRDTFSTELIYFRLKQADNDGSIHFSPVIAINAHTTKPFVVKPNPTGSGYVYIQTAEKTTRDCTFELFDATGRMLENGSITEPGLELSLLKYGNGLYLLKIDEHGKYYYIRILYP
ncbi:MAG: T9SS type A sorting domain-containing protein [Bacteroidetes bacterium]|nr:T9SS type A sorting domain-containing protein [Bacteroidota bacterium]